jgi:outer membrane immunogenic protein
MTSKTIRFGIAAAALMMAPLAAQAADLPRPSYKAPAYVAPAYASWSGFYIGANAGYAFGSSDWDLPPGVSTKPSGGLFGGTIGYNFQTGLWVWGLEGDLAYSTVEDTSSCGPGASCKTSLTYLATGRARLGYAGWNNFLPYITGGAAYGEIKASNSAFSEGSSSQFGWTAGAGLEYALWSNWSVKGEYLYVDLGSFDCGAACSGGPADNITFTSHIVRAGINYRF